MMENKICSRCCENKTIINFNKKKASKDGYRAECKACQKKYRNKEKEKNYYLNLTEEQRQKRNEYNKNFRLKEKLLRPPKPIKEVKIKKTYSETFLEKAKIKHNNKYDYSNAIIINSKIKIKIICPIHGEFEQTPNDHLCGYGCGECGGTKKLTTDKFIQKAKEKHGNKYNYSKVKYINSKRKTIVTCPIHGDFEINPNNHLSGKGCKQCSCVNGVWSYSQWEQKGLNSINFDGFKLYIIECWNDDEHFYKIGKTFKTINNRFKGYKYMPYNYNLIKLVEGDAKNISDLETKMKNDNQKHSYLPKMKFNGRYECFLTLTYC